MNSRLDEIRSALILGCFGAVVAWLAAWVLPDAQPLVYSLTNGGGRVEWIVIGSFALAAVVFIMALLYQLFRLGFAIQEHFMFYRY